MYLDSHFTFLARSQRKRSQWMRHTQHRSADPNACYFSFRETIPAEQFGDSRMIESQIATGNSESPSHKRMRSDSIDAEELGREITLPPIQANPPSSPVRDSLQNLQPRKKVSRTPRLSRIGRVSYTMAKIRPLLSSYSFYSLLN